MAHIRARLKDLFRMKLSPYEVLGDPKDLESARALAEQDRYQFEWWAVGLADGQPKKDKKKGADTGIDGMINFFDDISGKPKKIILQVKSGAIHPTYVRDLKGVVQREEATIGILITLNAPTKPILHEATTAGFYIPKLMPEKKYPKIQVLTVEQLLAGERPEYPQMGFEHQYKKAKPKPTKQVSLLD